MEILFGEGEDFHILSYNEKEIKEILKKNDFKKITEDNINDTRKVLTKYCDDLCERERSLFDKTTSISEMSKIGNYYLYLELNEKDYFVCIINSKDNKLNVFYINH